MSIPVAFCFFIGCQASFNKIVDKGTVDPEDSNIVNFV